MSCNEEVSQFESNDVDANLVDNTAVLNTNSELAKFFSNFNKELDDKENVINLNENLETQDNGYTNAATTLVPISTTDPIAPTNLSTHEFDFNKETHTDAQIENNVDVQQIPHKNIEANIINPTAFTYDAKVIDSEREKIWYDILDTQNSGYTSNTETTLFMANNTIVYVAPSLILVDKPDSYKGNCTAQTERNISAVMQESVVERYSMNTKSLVKKAYYHCIGGQQDMHKNVGYYTTVIGNEKDFQKLIKIYCTKCGDCPWNARYHKNRNCPTCETERILFCAKCKKQYKTYVSLSCHLNFKCHPRMSYRCSQCDYYTYNKHRMARHIMRP